MKRFLLLFLAGIGISVASSAQDFDVSFHGFVGVNATMDTRVSVMARNRHVYLYPLGEKLNDAGADLNSRNMFDIDAAYSRFGLDISGPQLAGFNTSAMIEGDFIGSGPVDSYFRLRHAIVKFAKDNWSLLGGQYWHPLFIPENVPGTVNVNAGAPFHPLIRSPQIRLTWQASDNTRLLFFVIDQNNFRSSGFGSNSTENALFPELDAQMKWKSGGAFAAFTAGLKTLAIPDDVLLKVNPEKVSSYHFNASFKYHFPKVMVKMEGVYGSNLSEMVMLGGVGQSVANDDFVGLQTASLWADIQTRNTEGWQPGFFAGYTANMGAREEVNVIPALSRSDGEVASVYAFSPRLKYIMGKAWIGAEWHFTSVAWGKVFDNYGVATDTKDYINHRLLLSLRYNF
jgi:hypothetical protein